MAENNRGQNICNMMECADGEHPLFRSFGLNTIDSNTRITRRTLQDAVAKWYPSTHVVSVTQDGNKYHVEVED